MEDIVMIIVTVVIVIALALHTILDCACVLCCLFPRHFPDPYLATLYVSVFRESINSENETLARVMVYWAAAMALVRLLALFFLSFDLLMAVAMMYALEGLVAEYEGFTSGTIKRKTARLISCFSLAFALVLTALLAYLNTTSFRLSS